MRLYSEKAFTYTAITIIVMLSFAVYFNTLWGEFVSDDLGISENRFIKDIRNIPAIFTSSLYSFQIDDKASPQNYYRPMAHIVGMINYGIFGLNPWGWHLTCIILNTAVTVLVFLISTTLLSSRLPAADSVFLNPAFIAAILFAVHPVHTEAVAWIGGATTEAGFTLFYLFAFYLYIKNQYILSISSFLISALFKETALTLPLLIFAYDYLLNRGSFPSLMAHASRLAPYLVTAGIYMALRLYALGGIAPFKAGNTLLTGYEYAINIFPLFAQYIWKLLFPLNLNSFHLFNPIHSILEWNGVIGIMITAIFILSVWSFKKIDSLASFCLVFIVIPLLPVFYIKGIIGITVGSVFAERYLYLPSAGFVLMAAIGIIGIGGRLTWNSKGITKLILTVFIIVIGTYSTLTVIRNSIWRSVGSLSADTIKSSVYAIKKSPENAIAHYYLGVAYSNQGRYEEAIKEYQAAIRLKPDDGPSHSDLGIIYAKQGRLYEAINEYQIALRLDPIDVQAYAGLGTIYEFTGNHEEAKKNLTIALKYEPGRLETLNTLGLVYLRMGHIDDAIVIFKDLSARDNSMVKARFNLGLAYAVKGMKDEARKVFEEVLRLNPKNVEAKQALELLSK